ncbi:Vitamin B12 import ATP-binding protein BtuD [Methanimicrococcus stummii]|uniref:Vitamin B12 import ATP-binding protein BtuD n=1 Tax=Methanimicrococcus stummii TaxID=3028294 RepID=A0AA97A7M7_9EURY|nr:ABC transporter ATP-binding protein [Methanimicrococcus sp. Es2]WNY28238.1 Vitamin B12 import ATP-binding protein BtuD [Methanimicrococcus sp. Es2]
MTENEIEKQNTETAMTGQKPVLSVRELTYQYPRNKTALEDVSFDIYPGEKVAVVGPNGAGKTTLFLHMNSTIKSRGHVFIEGIDVADMNPTQRVKEVGIMFADPDNQLFMPTVFDDIAFGPLNLGLSKAEVEQRVEETMAMTGISDLKDRVPHHLSLGQKKKVVLASIISMKPKVLVLDEPTANLDPKSKRDVLDIVNRLNADGMTIVISTHDVNLLSELADKVYVLNRKIIETGTPRDIFSNPNLLEENNLEASDIFKFFRLLSTLGFDCEELPLSFDEAVNEILKQMEESGGHIHLHTHDYSHEHILKLREQFQYRIERID